MPIQPWFRRWCLDAQDSVNSIKLLQPAVKFSSQANMSQGCRSRWPGADAQRDDGASNFDGSQGAGTSYGSQAPGVRHGRGGRGRQGGTSGGRGGGRGRQGGQNWGDPEWRRAKLNEMSSRKTPVNETEIRHKLTEFLHSGDTERLLDWADYDKSGSVRLRAIAEEMGLYRYMRKPLRPLSDIFVPDSMEHLNSSILTFDYRLKYAC